MTKKINLIEKFGLFKDHWRPKVVATVNGQEVKIVKVKGEFPGIIMTKKMNFSWSGKGTFGSNFATK